MALVNVAIKGRIFPYELSGPYFFKTGQNKGQSVESLMFMNRPSLVLLKNISDHKSDRVSNPNRLHLHLSWILNAGEFVRTTIACPHCSGDSCNNIEFFSVRRSRKFSYGHQYVCCGEPSCKFALLEEKSVPMPLRFSSLDYFPSKSEQKKIGDFFKEIFLGSDKFDPKNAFELFLNSNIPAQL